MNFEGFKDLIQRVAVQWYAIAKKEIIEMDAVNNYLSKNPFTAAQTAENEEAYERLMDVRCKLYVSKNPFTCWFGRTLVSLICLIRSSVMKSTRIMTPTWSSWSKPLTSLTCLTKSRKD